MTPAVLRDAATPAGTVASPTGSATSSNSTAALKTGVVRRWPKHRHELGPCLVWTGVQVQGRPYGRMYDPQLKRSGPSHLVVWRRVYPDKPIHKGWTVDHLCRVTLCQRPDHLELVTRAENTRRRNSNRARPRGQSRRRPRSRSHCSRGLTDQRSTSGQSTSTSCASCSPGSRSSSINAAAAAGRRRCIAMARRHAATPACSRSARWCSTWTAYRPMLSVWPASTGSATRRGHTRPQRHAGMWSSRSGLQCQPRAGTTSGSVDVQHCALRRTQPARTQPRVLAPESPARPAARDRKQRWSAPGSEAVA